ncbi:uncharacterized protein LOC113781363 [Coffea eugenioides]|uniref:uncharacterized protein LOC113781363 n=1 Tax=Coffea eugenioides TaxID=49369 RepID=UPI000F6093A2|nr:uncharacterized protein LOC113781363 [Coffea eugenioides]
MEDFHSCFDILFPLFSLSDVGYRSILVCYVKTGTDQDGKIIMKEIAQNIETVMPLRFFVSREVLSQSFPSQMRRLVADFTSTLRTRESIHELYLSLRTLLNFDSESMSICWLLMVIRSHCWEAWWTKLPFCGCL